MKRTERDRQNEQQTHQIQNCMEYHEIIVCTHDTTVGIAIVTYSTMTIFRNVSIARAVQGPSMNNNFFLFFYRFEKLLAK